jgi:hypothetical protein
MAPRILHFCIDELQWDCNGGRDCQYGSLRVRGGFGMNDKSALEEYRSKGCTVAQKAIIWRIFIYRYSSRMLTNWTDRLPAISGLAKQFVAEKAGASGGIISTSQEHKFSIQPSDVRPPFNEIDPGTYLAGLWSKDLKTGLCWRVEDGHLLRCTLVVLGVGPWTRKLVRACRRRF